MTHSEAVEKVNADLAEVNQFIAALQKSLSDQLTKRHELIGAQAILAELETGEPQAKKNGRRYRKLDGDIAGALVSVVEESTRND